MLHKITYIYLIYFLCSLSISAQNTKKDIPTTTRALNDSIYLKEVFKSETFDRIAEVGMVQNSISLVPDSVIVKRLKALDQRSPFILEFNPEVRAYINMYLGRNKASVSRMVGLSEYYYDIFEQTLDKYNIPLELKHLVVIESAINPKARSRVGASGLWQIMLPTGRLYGLYTDSYVDERFDPVKSSEAAAKLLKELYGMYGDWNMVLAAYNYGSGNVNKAIARSGGKKNFWEVRRYMPRETQNYVCAFIAANYIMNYYRQHDIIPERPKITYDEVDTVNVHTMVNFDLLSQKLNMPIEEIAFLNPSYKLNVIPYSTSRVNSIILPKEKAIQFAGIEQELYSQAKEKEAEIKKSLAYKVHSSPNTGGSVRYSVRKGDTLGGIAMKYKVSVSQIKNWNRLKNSNISIGQKLTIYPRK